ncbi:hypothetical protein pipiens_015929, partial [Culex pipiens pipiens]
MTPSRWSRILLTLLLAESISSENLSNYLVSVVQHLIATSPGTPHCVFIGLAKFDTSLESVLRDPKLDSVTKTVITQPLPTLLTDSSIPSDPLVIFIQAGGFSMFIAKLLLKFSPSSRMVVVYKKKLDFMAFEYLISFLFYYKTASVQDFVEANLRGKPVTYMTRRPLPGEHVMINVVKDLASFMNSTAQRSNHTCSIERTNVRDRCYRQHFEDNVINIDLSGYMVSEPFTCSHFECILTSIQNDGAMLRNSSPSSSTDPPPKIKTFADLIESNVKIKANLLQHPSITADPVFGQLMVNSSETIFNMDAASAHIIDRRWARLVLPMYYDRVQRLHRYRIMDQSLGKIPTLFILQHRSPLREALEFVLAVYGESGIYDYWFVAFMDLVMKQKFGRGGLLDGTDSSLSFEDLTLAWRAILFGLG